MNTLPKPHIRAERALTTRQKDGKPILQTVSDAALAQKVWAAETLIAQTKKQLAGVTDAKARARLGAYLARIEKTHDKLINEAKRRNRANRKAGAS